MILILMTVQSYEVPPLFDVTLEQFESWALDRLRILAEIESAFARNRAFDEVKSLTQRLLKKYLPLNANTATGAPKDEERRALQPVLNIHRHYT